MVGELQPAPAMRRQPVSAIVSGKGALRDDVEVLELFEELVVESQPHPVAPVPTPNCQLTNCQAESLEECG
jgi:hypothetical protein